jgi:tetratricopeptide (TPR) repeat protein
LGDIRRGKADFAGAIANYSEAIRLATSDTARSDYLAARATAYFSAGLLDEAAADSLEALRLVPRNAAAAIRLELIDRRKGRQGRLSKVAPQLNAASPIAKIVDLFLNRATPADVFSEFEKASPNDVRFKWFKRSRECTANYYVAQHALSQGKKTEAARLFRLVAVASRCPWYFGDARAELAALGI